ncbi:hypothetical protein AMK16_26845 [Streptomyces sp. CB00455]|nr:hypothetical protein AMK16_26845 [Streptomyces sp. CB00455]
MAGDWNGHGTDTVGYYRPSNATFYLSDSNTQANVDHQVKFGNPNEIPIKGDWNGDGTDKVGIHARPNPASTARPRTPTPSSTAAASVTPPTSPSPASGNHHPLTGTTAGHRTRLQQSGKYGVRPRPLTLPLDVLAGAHGATEHTAETAARAG